MTFLAIYAVIGLAIAAWFLWDMRDPELREAVMKETRSTFAPDDIHTWAAIIGLIWPVVIAVYIASIGEE